MPILPSSDDHKNCSIPHLPNIRLVSLGLQKLDCSICTENTGSGLELGTTLNGVLQNRAQFMWLLDAHNSDHSAGVSESVFRSIFYTCKQCGRYMTQRVSRDHHDDADLGDYTCINRTLGTDSDSETRFNAEKDSFRVKALPFPTLQPLSR